MPIFPNLYSSKILIINIFTDYPIGLSVQGKEMGMPCTGGRIGGWKDPPRVVEMDHGKRIVSIRANS